ncbi:MAG: C40 family peptidase [Muribaculaceae bacterium]|nr:C40 family peptidase [Muribaculaceae bacterium]
MSRNLIGLIILAVGSLFGQNMKATEPIFPLTGEPDLIAGAELKKLKFADFGMMGVVDYEKILDAEAERKELAADLLEYAHKFMGLRYRRGGKTEKGFDCSGFTGYVFRQFGYKLGASSGNQYMQGEKIDSKLDVEPGDLVFFGGRGAGARVGHVGIAVSTDPETGVITFIHSATSSGIRLDKTSDPYYSRRYLGARRVITTGEE